jgi:hypothetical protein
MNDGRYDLCYAEATFDNKYDIVCILPMESTTSDKHPSIAWWESCPWITDRKPTKEDGDAFGRVIVKTIHSKVIACTTFVQDVNNNEAWIHHYDWKPPTLSDKEKALESDRPIDSCNSGSSDNSEGQARQTKDA